MSPHQAFKSFKPSKHLALNFSFLFSFLFFLVVPLLYLPPAWAKHPAPIVQIDFNQSKEVHDFIEYMMDQHEFSLDELQTIFSQIKFNAKSVELIKPAPISKPKNWAAYRARFIEPIRINAGVKFWNKYAQELDRAEQQFGVPAQIIAGIIGIETIFGKNTGRFRVIDVLATLGFSYPDTHNKKPRMLFFRDELAQVLLFARESGIDPFDLLGSYAGAIGWPQFMPSSIREYAVDFDGDGKIDLRNSPVDAIGSVANYLSRHGWETGLPLVFPAQIIHPHPETMLATNLTAASTLDQLAATAIPTQQDTPPQLLYGLIDLQNGSAATEYWFATQNFFAITKYNRSYFYAMSVLELGEAVCAHRKCDLRENSSKLID